MQLYPEIEVHHADETGTLCKRAAEGKYTWVFAGRTLYLVCPQHQPAAEDDVMRPNPHSCHMRVVHSRDVAPLLALYLRETGPPA